MSELARAARLAGLAEPGPLAALGPLLAQQVIEAVDLHTCALLAGRFGERDPDVLLAAALAVRAPRHGHVCVDLRAPSGLPEGVGPAREAWAARVGASPLVRAPGPGDTPLVLRGSLLYTDRYFAYEESLRVALQARFTDLRQAADPALLAQGLDALFSPGAQRRAAEIAVQRGAAVISGGPGTGKTWTVRNLLTLLYAQAPADPPRVALAAPTGKAAARLVEALRAGLDDHLQRAQGALPDPAHGAEGLRAFLNAAAPSTLHRLLGWRPDTPTRFHHHAGRPLPLDVVIVDEASMVDLALMAKLVDALPADARLILLGDRHQLTSVEAGTVLGDLCAAGEARPGIALLTQSRRFGEAGGIGRFAHAVVEGRVDEALAALPDHPDPGEIARVGHGARGALPAPVRAMILEGARPWIERLRAGPRPGEALADLHADALRAFDGFRILCAHRKGRLGVEGIDAAARALLADAGLLDPTDPWWLGRPILLTRNDPSVGRYNGDVGLVVRGPDDAVTVAFPAEGGGVSWLAPARLPAHETALAITVHKSQGSEFDRVLVVLPTRPSRVLTRELVYTAVTRARRQVVLLGDRPVLADALGRRVHRASGLAEALGPPG